MKSLTASALLSIAALSSGSLAAFSMNFARAPAGIARLPRRNLSPRATITETLANNVTGGSYMVTVKVGTPGQEQSLAIDTGSSDVWVLDVNADACTDPAIQAQYQEGCSTTYNPSKSTSYKKKVPNGFSIQYGDGTQANGDYITDDLAIAGATIKSQEMGLAYNSTLFTGLLGVGYDTNEASDSSQDAQNPFIYPSIIDQMVSQGLISTKAYSLYLDDLEASTGSIIFGGLDSDKYHGNLLQLPIVPDTAQNGSEIFAEFAVALTSFSMTGEAGNTTSLGKLNAPVVLDSGTTLSYVPQDLAELIYERLNAVDDTANSGLVFVDCDVLTSAPKMTFNFGFGGSNGVSIKVPIDEMVFQVGSLSSTGGSDQGASLPFTNTCGLGINGQQQQPYILGDTFLRSAYVVYDLKNNLIAIAQTNFNSTSSSIVDFTADATTIPNVSGVASSVAVTETATGLPGGHSATGNPTGKATGTGSTSSTTGSLASFSTSTSSKGAAARSVPTFDATALLVFGLSSVFAVLGGGWFLA